MRPPTLTAAGLKRGLRYLSETDRDLAAVVRRLGPPPMWAREPGFPTLVRIMLEQQVSLASARAVYERLLAVCEPLEPARLVALDDARLRAAGFSRQKIAYVRDLAWHILDGRLDLPALALMDDDAVRAELVRVKGIGHWTSDIYLLMALRRPDAWPSLDLALAVAAQEIKRLPGRPTRDELEELAAAWRPWRAVAARVLWRHYLSRREARPTGAGAGAAATPSPSRRRRRPV